MEYDSNTQNCRKSRHISNIIPDLSVSAFMEQQPELSSINTNFDAFNQINNNETILPLKLKKQVKKAEWGSSIDRISSIAFPLVS